MNVLLREVLQLLAEEGMRELEYEHMKYFCKEKSNVNLIKLLHETTSTQGIQRGRGVGGTAP